MNKFMPLRKSKKLYLKKHFVSINTEEVGFMIPNFINVIPIPLECFFELNVSDFMNFAIH